MLVKLPKSFMPPANPEYGLYIPQSPSPHDIVEPTRLTHITNQRSSKTSKKPSVPAAGRSTEDTCNGSANPSLPVLILSDSH